MEALKKNDHDDRAIADYDDAIRLDPEYGAAYNNRGNAHEKKGNLERAEADRQQARRLQSKPDEK